MAEEIGPDYQRLMAVIRSRIAAGEYAVGKPIPSTSKLEQQTGMSRPVVRRAVEQLKSDGVLEGHPGKAVYVKAMPAEAAKARQDVRALSAQLAELEREVHELREPAATSQPVGLDQKFRDLDATIGRIEANLIDLYGKLGYDYPQGGIHDGAQAAVGRGRRRR